MTDVFSKTIFLDSQPNIVTNVNLRDPQRFAYSALCDHFLVNQSDEDALIVLPTGVGKTGLIAIAPYMISIGLNNNVIFLCYNILKHIFLLLY